MPTNSITLITQYVKLWHRTSISIQFEIRYHLIIVAMLIIGLLINIGQGSKIYITIPNLTLSQCTLAGPVYTEMPLVDPMCTGTSLGDPANTCRVHWNTTGNRQSHIDKKRSIHASLNAKMMGYQAASGQVSVNSAFNWKVLLSNSYQFCSSIVWVLQYHTVHALDMSTIIILVFCVFGIAIQMKSA